MVKSPRGRAMNNARPGTSIMIGKWNPIAFASTLALPRSMHQKGYRKAMVGATGTRPWMMVALGSMLMLFVYVFFIVPSQALSYGDAYQPPVTLAQLKEMVRAEVVMQTRDVEQQLVEDHAGTGRSTYSPVKQLPESRRLRILVTGGSGFVGSHLTDRLMRQGHTVIVMDNFFTGRQKNVQQWIGHPHFTLVNHDVVEPIMLEVDQVYHLACPASPPHYQYNPIKTIKTNTQGTLNILGLAKRTNARILLASTSEVYGDPEVHPQKESYFGNVNPIGPRACYDEGKRVAETMMYAYQRQSALEVRVARIFNTFGPRMHPHDGRVVSNFIIQALQGHPMTIYGDGSQTRSFQYVDDLVSGLILLMSGDYSEPVNLGNPAEFSVGDFARLIKQLTNSSSEIVFKDATQDDPKQRKPDITTARKQLGWQPIVGVTEGLEKTIEYFRNELRATGGVKAVGPLSKNPPNRPDGFA